MQLEGVNRDRMNDDLQSYKHKLKLESFEKILQDRIVTVLM